MKQLKTLAILLTVLFIPHLAFSAHVSKGTLHEFMDISGLNRQIAEFPGMIQAGLQQAHQEQPTMSEELYTTLANAAATAFDPTLFRVYISNQVRTGISENDAGKLIDWYGTDLGKEISAAEIAASTPTAYQAMIADAQTLMANTGMMSNARKIDKLTGATDLAMEIQTKTALAVFAAVATAQNPGQKVDLSAFKKQMEAQMPQMRANAEMTMLLSFIYAYKDIDPAKVDKYIAFLATPEAQKANASVKKGMTAAFVKSINNFAKSIRIALRKSAG